MANYSDTYNKLFALKAALESKASNEEKIEGMTEALSEIPPKIDKKDGWRGQTIDNPDYISAKSRLATAERELASANTAITAAKNNLESIGLTGIANGQLASIQKAVTMVGYLDNYGISEASLKSAAKLASNGTNISQDTLKGIYQSIDGSTVSSVIKNELRSKVGFSITSSVDKDLTDVINPIATVSPNEERINIINGSNLTESSKESARALVLSVSGTSLSGDAIKSIYQSIDNKTGISENTKKKLRDAVVSGVVTSSTDTDIARIINENKGSGGGPTVTEPKYHLISGNGPNLGNDTLEGNGAAVYVVNDKGERFHITGAIAQQMIANGTWSEPVEMDQAQVDAMAFKGQLVNADEVSAINSKYRLISGNGANLGHDPVAGNGAAVYLVNEKGEKFHISGAIAQQMIDNGTWSTPVEASQAQVDAMTTGAPITSLAGLNNPGLPAPVDPLVPQYGPPLVYEGPPDTTVDLSNDVAPLPTPSQSDGETTTVDNSAPAPQGNSGSYVRDTKDSGFAYPWSAATSTGTTDVTGTIGKAVAFMNEHEGKNYKYDSVKGTIQAADGSFISKDDVQSLNNIIVNYSKQDFKLPASSGGQYSPNTNTPNVGLGATSIQDPSNGLNIVGGAGGNLAVDLPTGGSGLPTLP